MTEAGTYLVLISVSVLLLFSFVILVGAPYLPTLNSQTKAIFELLKLKPGQTLLELGSGDGRVLLEAAKQGIKSIGYELNPILVIWSRLRTWRYRKLVSVKWANYWQVKLPKTDGIYVFLLAKYMKKLDKKITQETTKPVSLVSFAFEIPKKRPKKQLKGMFLYHYKPVKK